MKWDWNLLVILLVFIVYAENRSAAILFSFGFSCTVDVQTQYKWQNTPSSALYVESAVAETTVNSFKCCLFHRVDNNIQTIIIHIIYAKKKTLCFKLLSTP